MNTNITKPTFSKKQIKKESNLMKKTIGFKIFFGFVFLVLCFHALSLIYPVIWLFFNSLKNSYEYVSSS